MQVATNELRSRRKSVTSQRSAFETNDSYEQEVVSAEILSSWQCCADELGKKVVNAPVDEEDYVSHLRDESPLSTIMENEHDGLAHLVAEGDLALAISDPCGRILWTQSSHYMRRRTEDLNFVPGGHWGERVVGTNAIGLALKIGRSVTVFSSEHYLPFVQDWVCYASPIIHPQSGHCVGVLDVSTTWNKHTPLGEAATIQLANSMAQQLPEIMPRAELEIYGLGQPYVIFEGERIKLTPRQIEILSVLAFHPDGISLQRLHACLYRDSVPTMGTLKAEISHLRRRLKGKIGSRPYRLDMSVHADFLDILKVLGSGKVNLAVSMFRGSFLPYSESPEIEQWRYFLDAAISDAVRSYDDPKSLLPSVSETQIASEIARNWLG